MGEAQQHTTWEDLNTRRGQLIEMQAALRNVARTVEAARRDYPEGYDGASWLNSAGVYLEACNTELEDLIGLLAKS